MDAVELARQIAARLHFEAVVAGDDPTQPYEFAKAEAARRGIAVEGAVPSAAMLDGGRATYMADVPLILHERTGTAFGDGFLCAHEIGHDALGDHLVAGEVQAMEPARQAEESAGAAERAVDYGRRQRREVQMDLFAREFLLPRALVRRLHVEEGLTATEIAARYGAPFDVVAQQLLDATLLPPVGPVEVATAEQRELNPEQAAAAGHRGPAYLLEAGPGTGKTQTLVARVLGLLRDGVPPSRILLLTFSNKAAAEMAERIAAHDRAAAVSMWIGTFHAFGLDLVRRFHAELGLPKDPRMMDRTEAVELLEQEFPRLGLRHYRDLYDPTDNISALLKAISRAKDEVVDDQAYAALAAAMLERATTADQRESAEKAVETAKVYTVYETLKRNAHRVDFGDLVSMPVRLLESRGDIREMLRAKYQHVLVDEYQDVNRSSVRLLEALCGAGENLWVVGDARQAIYRFRGASSFNLSRFGREDFPGAARGRLRRNYRSTSAIVQAMSNYARGMQAAADGELLAEPGRNGVAPELRTFASKAAQSVGVADAVEEMCAAGYAYRDQAILCTGNERMSVLGRELEALGVPVLFLGSLFDRPEVKDVFALLSLLVDRRASALVRGMAWIETPLGLGDVDAVLSHLREGEGAWQQDFAAIPGVSEKGREALRGLAGVLGGFSEESQPWAVLARVLLDRTRVAATIAESDNIAQRARGIAIWQTMNFLCSQPPAAGQPIARVLDRVRRLIRLQDDRDLRQLPLAAQGLDAVRLMTVHAAKGLEFDVVHVPSCNAGTIPNVYRTPPCLPPDGMIAGGTAPAVEEQKAAHAVEQECIFYVALSRAREQLVLSAYTHSGNRTARLSPYLERLEPSLSRRLVTPTRSLPLSAEAAALDFVGSGDLRISAEQIAQYEKCPRRFLYTHILRIGGRRTATPFMQMHDAVRDVWQGVLSGALSLDGEGTVGRHLDAAFLAQGLAEHGYRAEFREYALSMLEFFRAAREGQTVEATEPMRLRLESGEIVVMPDEVVTGRDGRRRVRRIRSGRLRSKSADDLGTAAFMLAAAGSDGGGAVEILYLTDGGSEVDPLSSTQLGNRREKLAEALREIRAGNFPARPEERTCPKCPAFFVCGPTPVGRLEKNFEEIYRS